MADRYWVGGTAAWDATAGTKWALTSGGAGGQAVPNSSDNVFFDAASGVVTVTLGITADCLNFDCTGFTGTITGTSTIQPRGSFTLNSAMTWLATGNVNPLASTGSHTITTAGKTLGANLNFGLNGGTAIWTLQNALTVNGTLTVTYGTFTTNDYNVTAASLSSSNSNTRTINLGSSTVTLSGTGALSFATTTNLTLNAGTSSIICTNTTSAQIIFGASGSPQPATLYNLSYTATTSVTHILRGVLTINNLAVTGPASAGFVQLGIEGSQTINGTLSTTGTAGNRRVWFRSQTYGLAQTLTINSAPSLTDADFRDLYVIGTAAPISGTRIGDLRGCSGITFSTPKTVYWTTTTNSTFSGNNWAATIGGAASTDNFPLAQDTATFTNTGLNVSATASLDGVIPYTGSVDMSARTNAMTLNITQATTVYGNWKNGSGTGIFNTGALTFSGRNTQTITSAGKAFSPTITIDSYGGTVELTDAFSNGTSAIGVVNGTFDTKGYAVTTSFLSSNVTSVRTIKLGSSTVTLSDLSQALSVGIGLNLTFDAGTSLIVITNPSSSTPLDALGIPNLYDVSFTKTATYTVYIRLNSVRNLTITPPATAGITNIYISANATITGTLTVAGASPVRRIFTQSSVLGTQRNLTVGTLVADDCDFRDIRILGAAVNSTPTRAGDCGGNSGIVFPAPKTVYWNLAGAQSWSATGWASGSGSTPDINNFPLAQDTAVFDNAGSVTGVISINAAWNIGSFNASARTSAMTFNLNTCQVYGNWTHGTGVTFSAQNAGVAFCCNGGTQTITSNGVSFGGNRLQPTTVNGGKVVLADAFVSSASIQFSSGEFDAAGFNLTCSAFEATNTTPIRVLRMGGGLWTLTGSNNPWGVNPSSTLTFYKSTSDILLSDNSTAARTFSGFGLSYNKLTIGGATGTSTLTITDNNQFTELASTKTVAHTIALGTTTQTFGAWTVSGTAGNVVTVTGSGTSHVIAGSRVSGVDYLAMGTIGFAATSPGEFYAGANSTGTNATIIKTAAPAPVTRYWRGGTGTWDTTTTTNWSDTSGGAGGASVPTSADAVVFDSASNATAYTVTCTATQLRCGSLTMAGPVSGNITWAGTAPLAVHDNVSLAATGITRSYTGALTLSGSTTDRTLTTNGVQLNSNVTINGVGCGWNLGSAFIMFAGSNQITVTNGSFDTKDFNLSTYSLISSNINTRVIKLGASTLTLIVGGASPVDFSNPLNLLFDCGTSTITFSNTQNTFNGGGLTFYNVTNAATNNQNFIINGTNTFNNLTIAGKTSSGISPVLITANQTINGTLTLSAGTNATMRTFLQSNTIGTARTLTCAAVSATDADFRDIIIAGAAAPVSGTRLGDCKGNSGITFDAAKTVYWNLAGNNNWSATAWATSAGGTPDVNNFPLAQDTAVFTSTSPSTGESTNINAAWNIGTIDMSARTTNTMTLATATQNLTIYGNWINGSGVTVTTSSGSLRFSGRNTQEITSAGKTLQPFIVVNSLGGTVRLNDAASLLFDLTLTQGTIDFNGYNLTARSFNSNNTNIRVINIGSGMLTFNLGSTDWGVLSTNLTVTGTGTISLTSASPKTFAGGGTSYSGITLNQGGAGTLTITGNNTFANITNTYKLTGATSIALGTTTQRVGAFGASGEAGRVLTVTGSSASSPATLVFTGSGQATTPTTDYLAITGVRAYSLTDTWSAGANSINNGSLGWLFAAATAAVVSAAGRFFLFFN